MASSKVPVTFTFQKDGTQPPVYIAGSFSDPSWQPQEMDASMDQQGEYIFTKEIEASEASEIQYKYRIGSGDWWTIDPTADTVTDAQGNVNNVLKVLPNKPNQELPPAEVDRVDALKESASPSGVRTPDVAAAATAAEVAESAELLDPVTPEPNLSDEEAGRAGVRRLSSTPILEVARTAAEVAEDAAKLDGDDSEAGVQDDGSDCPMFSHECLGAPGIKVHTPGTEEPGHHLPLEDTPDKPNRYPDESNIDFDDPQLEHFPSENRDTIMAAVRRLSSSVDADRPVVSSKKSSGLSSEDQNAHVVENAQDSSDLIYAAGATESAASLQAIAEDDEAYNEAGWRNGAPNQLVQHSGPAQKPEDRSEPIASDDDEGIAMYNPSYQGSAKGEKDDSSSQVPETNASDVAVSEMGEPAQDETTLENGDKNMVAASPKTIPAGDASVADPSDAAPTEPITSEDVSFGAESVDASEARSPLDACSQTNLQKHTNDDRPDSPSSTRSLSNVHKDGKWLRAFIHTVLVDWIGGLLLLLCGRNNRA
ncbi:hypothetical protein F5X99DRAFT_378410 [Biscogniauxia marginata]|nr:hypothetical protein F5X99DRAFT_378410 [Biscogniauxia marginata]